MSETYYQRNRERILERQKAYYQRKRDSRRNYQREYMARMTPQQRKIYHILGKKAACEQ